MMKRRVIYMTDDEWEATTQEARRLGVTASQLIRDCLRRGHIRETLERWDQRPVTAVPKHR